MTFPARFTIKSLCRSTAARTGVLDLGRGLVQTPVFMPVGTQGAVRALPPHWLREVGAQIVLANTYHLHQRPGEALVEKLGGLHRFMAVDLPILTDSGGFQVFSLRKKELTEEGVSFAYELDGKKTFLSPETSMKIQMALGSNIAMAFDECLPADSSREVVETSIDRTFRWAERCIAAHTRVDQSLFGIVQGGMFGDLRKRSAQQITSLPFDGFAVGGLSVGEGPEKMNAVLAETMPHMPPDKARYLMGVGRPQDLVDGVATGIDMFDCVIPTRHARSGTLYTFQGRIRITHAKYRRDAYPIDTACNCYTCRNFTRAYVHHLFEIGEVLGSTLSTIHNLMFFSDLMAKIRSTIEDGTFMQFRKDIHALYPEKDEEEQGKDEARRRFAEDALPHRDRDVAAAVPKSGPASREDGQRIAPTVQASPSLRGATREAREERPPRTDRASTAPQAPRDFRGETRGAGARPTKGGAESSARAPGKPTVVRPSESASAPAGRFSGEPGAAAARAARNAAGPSGQRRDRDNRGDTRKGPR